MMLTYKQIMTMTAYHMTCNCLVLCCILASRLGWAESGCAASF